jgi:Raf kinase inhibitor-like YbhB/YbcL family protein
MKLTSSAFHEGGAIPKDQTCDGKNISPSLTWSDVPRGAKTLALLCDDPDAPAGVWVHWVLFNIPATVNGLQPNVLKTRTIPNGARQGINDFRQVGYGGPCPPKGASHRYFFKLYALDADLNLDPGCTKSDVERSMAGHVLAEANLMGRYQRS